MISSTVVTCGSLPIPPFGNVSTDDETYGGKATYSCNTGYNLNDSTVRTCQPDGIWDGSQPFCSSKKIKNINFKQ